MLNPSAVPNDALIASGCTLIPTTDELLLHARAYWLLISGAWLPNFVTKGLNGFFLGTRRWGAYFMPTIINGVVPLVIWFAMLPAAQACITPTLLSTDRHATRHPSHATMHSR